MGRLEQDIDGYPVFGCLFDAEETVVVSEQFLNQITADFIEAYQSSKHLSEFQEDIKGCDVDGVKSMYVEAPVLDYPELLPLLDVDWHYSVCDESGCGGEASRTNKILGASITCMKPHETKQEFEDRIRDVLFFGFGILERPVWTVAAVFERSY